MLRSASESEGEMSKGLPCVQCHRKSHTTVLYVDEQRITGKVVDSKGPFCSYKCLADSLVGRKAERKDGGE